MQNAVNDLLPSLQSLGLWGYWVIGLLAFGEALILTSLFAPGTIVVLIGGVLVAQGLYDFGDMVWFVSIGTILGAEVSFRIGARGGHLFQEGRRVFSAANLDRGKRFFVKYGPPSIIMGHFLGPLRPVVPVIAGLSGMSPKRFFLWNVIGGFAYTLAFLSIGYFFGTALDLVGATATRAGLFALAVLLVLVALWFLTGKLRQALPFVVSVLRSVGQAIRDNPDVRRLVSRNPAAFQFLANRFSRARFSGLPITVMGSAFAYFLLLYANSTLDFVTQGQIVQTDIRIANLLAAFRDPSLVRFFTIVTAFGSWRIVLTLAVAVSILLWLWPRLQYLPGLWIVLLGNQLTVTLLKNIFARARPELAVYGESSYSFPSGHSAVSVAFFGFLTYILIRERVGPVLVTFGVGVLVVFLIGLSRLYLVEHYVSDVLNGYLVGALWALLGIWLAEWRQIKGKPAQQVPMPRWRRIAAFGVIVVAVIATWIVVGNYQQTRNVLTVAAVTQLDQSVPSAFAVGLLPTTSESILGTAQEPISVIVLVQDEPTFLKLFAKAGWHLTDKPSFDTLSRAAFAVWFNRDYDTAPVTPAFWNDQPHDFGFQAETKANSLRQRHHARFWNTGFRTTEGMLVFVGTASFDDGLKWGLTHHIDPNIDAERDFLLADLVRTNLVAVAQWIDLVPPVLGQNLAGDPFFTDGKSVVVQTVPGQGTGPED